MPRALWRALAQLEDLGPARVSDLAAADRMDARAVRPTITDAGLAAFAKTREAAARALLPRLRRLDPESLRTLTAGVQALRLVLEADAPTDVTEDDA